MQVLVLAKVFCFEMAKENIFLAKVLAKVVYYIIYINEIGIWNVPGHKLDSTANWAIYTCFLQAAGPLVRGTDSLLLSLFVFWLYSPGEYEGIPLCDPENSYLDVP